MTFCGARVLVHPGVYVPRWQSEPLVRLAASRLPEAGRVIDVCTGAGAIAVALREMLPSAQIVGTEIDPIAAECARDNGVAVVECDLLDGVPETFLSATDLVIGVVPYVPSGELRLLPRDVLAYEPRRALDGGIDGLGLLRRSASDARRFLRDGARLLLELGGDEGEAFAHELAGLGYEGLELFFDDDGDLRGISASWRP